MQKLYRMKDLFFFSRIPETTCEKYTFSKVIFIKGIADFFYPCQVDYLDKRSSLAKLFVLNKYLLWKITRHNLSRSAEAFLSGQAETFSCLQFTINLLESFKSCILLYLFTCVICECVCLCGCTDGESVCVGWKTTVGADALFLSRGVSCQVVTLDGTRHLVILLNV